MADSTRLNTLRAPHKQAARRVGRGIGSNYGKTAGRGHKGQRARSGARRDGVFEGGQMPLNRRVPKRGFNSRLARCTAQLRLTDVNRIKSDTIDLAVLRELGVLGNGMKRARIFCSGKVARAVTIGADVKVTRGARVAIEAVGGSVTVAAGHSGAGRRA